MMKNCLCCCINHMNHLRHIQLNSLQQALSAAFTFQYSAEVSFFVKAV